MKTSSCGHRYDYLKAKSRDAVLIAYAQDEIARTACSTMAFGERLNSQIWLLSGCKTREHGIPNLLELQGKIMGLNEYCRLADTWRRRVERWLNGSVEIPAWLEEPWCGALSDPWSRLCRNELQGRHGFLPVAIPDPGEPIQDAKALGEFLRTTGDVLRNYAAVIADGQIDPNDRCDAGRTLQAIFQLEGICISLRQQICQSVFGTEAAGVTPFPNFDSLSVGETFR